jgi:hypothetical protein
VFSPLRLLLSSSSDRPPRPCSHLIAIQTAFANATTQTWWTNLSNGQSRTNAAPTICGSHTSFAEATPSDLASRRIRQAYKHSRCSARPGSSRRGPPLRGHHGWRRSHRICAAGGRQYHTIGGPFSRRPSRKLPKRARADPARVKPGPRLAGRGACKYIYGPLTRLPANYPASTPGPASSRGPKCGRRRPTRPQGQIRPQFESSELRAFRPESESRTLAPETQRAW